MNILYINHYAGSLAMGMEYRPYYLAREWVRAGHDVTVLAASYTHMRQTNPKVAHDFQEQMIDGIRYLWVKTSKYKGNGLGRVFNIMQFVYKLKWHAEKLAFKYKPDVVIASSTYPLDTYPAYKIAGIARAAYVFEVHDMWPLTPMYMWGLKPSHPVIRYLQRAEDHFCTHADAVIALVPAAGPYYREHGMPLGNYYCVPNGIVAADWPDKPDTAPEYRDYMDAIHAKYRKIICFFGSHTKNYCLDYLLEAAARLSGYSVAVLLFGEGGHKPQLLAMKEKLQLDNVFFHNPVPKHDIPGILSMVDAIYVGAVDTPFMHYGIAMNKMFDAMASGKPIIFAANVPNNYIDEYDCGITVCPENTSALVEGIKLFLGMSDERLAEIGRNGRRAAFEHFEYSRLASRMLEILQKVSLAEK